MVIDDAAAADDDDDDDEDDDDVADSDHVLCLYGQSSDVRTSRQTTTSTSNTRRTVAWLRSHAEGVRWTPVAAGPRRLPGGSPAAIAAGTATSATVRPDPLS